MNSGKDPIGQFLSSLKALQAEKLRLEERIKEIDAALNGTVPEPVVVPRRNRSSPINKLSLAAAVAQVTRKRPLTKSEILEAVQAIGYRFNTSDPMNSLNAMLYGSGKFTHSDGKFRAKHT